MSHAATFHALHKGPDILILPNAWDAASAVDAYGSFGERVIAPLDDR